MDSRRLCAGARKLLIAFLPCAIFSSTVHASFIESTIGTAVVNDATAAQHNPAALVLLKNPQIIPLGTLAYFNTHFTGNATRASTGMTESGASNSHTHYYSPSMYFAMPTTDKITVGLAILSNYANRNAEDASVLRYVQASNDIQDYDVMPAIGIKINDHFAVGGGINFSYANFDLRPVTGFPGAGTPDSESHNQSDGTGIGANIGFLFQPVPATVIGFNYRSVTTYRLSGKSVFEGNPEVTSNNYHFRLWTPARSVFSINQFVTPTLGFMSTVQFVQWSTLTNVHVYGIANAVGTTPVIVNASVPFYLRDAWIFTLGTHYRIAPKWIVRFAGTYNQSAGNPHYQIANGDSIILGISTGYEINKTFTIDGSYAHAFIKNQNINITTGRYLVSGVNAGSRDAVSLKLTINL